MIHPASVFEAGTMCLRAFVSLGGLCGVVLVALALPFSAYAGGESGSYLACGNTAPEVETHEKYPATAASVTSSIADFAISAAISIFAFDWFQFDSYHQPGPVPCFHGNSSRPGWFEFDLDQPFFVGDPPDSLGLRDNVFDERDPPPTDDDGWDHKLK